MALNLKQTPAIMGIINRSPNSFFNPCDSVEAALFYVEKMMAAQVDIIDVGGEATNPFVDIEQESPSIQEEIDRVAPTVLAIKKRFDVLVSVDTSQPGVMQAAIANGVDIINDQRALRIPGALDVVAKAKVAVVLMHFFLPIRKPESTSCEQMLTTIKSDLQYSVDQCLKAGIDKENIIIDPGFGGGNYGKSSSENYYLLSHLDEFKKLKFPVLVGWSRKSMIGEALGNAKPAERLYGSLAAETILALKQPAIIRTHDVAAVYDALRVVNWYQEQCEVESDGFPLSRRLATCSRDPP